MAGGNENGFLTEEDKRFLKGIKQYENRQMVRDRRYRIRERSKNGLQDFALMGTLEDRDIDSIFSDVSQQNQQEDLVAIYDFLCAAAENLEVGPEIVLQREVAKWQERGYEAKVSVTGDSPKVEVYEEDEDTVLVEYEI